MKKRGIRKAKKTNKILLKLVFVGALILLLNSLNPSNWVKINLGQNYLPISKISPITTKVSSDSAIITPYPTLSPKPTQTILSGYCLKVPVLMYHHIQPQVDAQEKGQASLSVDSQMFAAQVQYLSQNGYTPIWANELVSALLDHSLLPAKPVVITLDDGYKDNYIYALPILRQYGFKANLMLATGLMGNPDMLSWDEVKALKDSGLFYFTNHTWSHYAITRGPQSTIESEIDTGNNQIQSYTGQKVNTFTYPYGSYSDNAIQTLEKMGYVGAFSEIPGQYQCDSFIMTLHRTRIGNAPLWSYGL